MIRLLVVACLLMTATAAGRRRDQPFHRITDEVGHRRLQRRPRAGLGSRDAALASGANRLAFAGVSRQMLPSSAMIITSPDVKLRDIVYDLGLLTQEALLRRSVGGTVGLVRKHPTTGEEEVDSVNRPQRRGKPS